MPDETVNLPPLPPGCKLHLPDGTVIDCSEGMRSFATLAVLSDRTELVSRLGKVGDALRALLDDSQHVTHPDCEDGYCPVRDGRATLRELDAWFDLRAAASLGKEGGGKP